MAGGKMYRVEPYVMGKRMEHGVVETDNFYTARRAFIKSWNSMNYGVKVYRDGVKLNMREVIMLFRPDGFKEGGGW